MGYIKPEVYQSICNDANIEVPKVFIETGTFKGGVPLRMLEENGNLKPFEKIYTIELGYDICKVASRRYKLLEQGPAEKSILHTNDTDEQFKANSWQEYFNGKLTLCHGDSANEIKSIFTCTNAFVMETVIINQVFVSLSAICNSCMEQTNDNCALPRLF